MTNKNKALTLGLVWLALFAVTFCGFWGWPLGIAYGAMVISWVVAWSFWTAFWNYRSDKKLERLEREWLQ